MSGARLIMMIRAARTRRVHCGRTWTSKLTAGAAQVMRR